MKPDANGRVRPWRFYLHSIRSMLVPRFIRIFSRRKLLKNWEMRPDASLIKERVDFYCLPSAPFSLGPDAPRIKDITLHKTHSRYYFDLHEILGGFHGKKRVGFVQGDILSNPSYPCLMKGRRLKEGRENGVILNLDKIRHFCVPDDPIPFEKKTPKLIFRGEAEGKPARLKFLEMWADHPLCDLGDTAKKVKSQWFKDPITISDHFKYKFVLTLEGNDVASALMWVMASNCIPVMPRPTVETWLMHSRLVPGEHYIEIKSDFSDVANQLEYYISHPEEAKKISEASKEWIRQFGDEKREKIIASLVVEKYLKLSGQPEEDEYRKTDV